MRILLISLLAIVLGVGTGLGMTWIEFRNVVEYFRPVSLSKPAVSTEVEAKNSKELAGPVAVVVGGHKFDFGVLNHEQTRDKTFVIRNEGTEPLNLSWGGESCGKCIANRHNFAPTVVAPGDSCEVIVSYATMKMDQFSESAYIATNDPRHPSLQLQIVGYVTMALKLEPQSLALNSISTSEPTAVNAKLFGFHSDKLELVKYEFSDPSSGSFMELTAKPLDEAATKAEKHARAGLDLQLRFKPGLPIGPLSQNITLTTLGDAEQTIVLPITGTVVGDLSVYGKNYDANTGNLNIGIVNRNVGVSTEIFVLVKGPQRNDVQLRVGDVDPAETLQVSVGERSAIADGKTIKIPVKIVVPKGTAAMNRLGNQQGKAAKITLESTHSVSKQLPITVRFAVE